MLDWCILLQHQMLTVAKGNEYSALREESSLFGGHAPCEKVKTRMGVPVFGDYEE